MTAHACTTLLPTHLQWQEVALGESGDAVYRSADGSAYAKLAGPRGARGLHEERLRTEWLARFGVGTPAVLGWAQSDAGACLVTTAIAGVPASELAGPDLLRAWPSMVSRLQTLHQLPVQHCPFARGLTRMYALAEDVVQRNAVNPEFLDDEQRHVAPAVLLSAVRAELPRRLAQERGDLVVCHGDACLPNFVVNPETLECVGLIDLGRLGCADRHVDLALLLGNARESWATSAQADAARQQVIEIMGIETDDARLDFYLRLDPLTWG